jgi:hypothetical protein
MRWLASVALVLAAATSAHANGRNPHTVGIYFKPGDANTLYVSTTFGLLSSKDGGCTFNWMCEQSIGYGGTWDPHYAIASDGTIFGTTYEGLRISRDGGCTWSTAQLTDGLWVDALTIGPTGEIWVGIAETAGMNDVLSSTDNGATFQSKGMSSAAVWWKSVAVAPSNAQRVYITGYQVADTPQAYFYRTDNGGTDWTPVTLASITYAGAPVVRVQAVDPANQDIVYMTSEGAAPQGAGDRLYRSTNAGATFDEVLVAGGFVHDVVFRDAKIYVSTQRRTSTSLVGGPTYVSSDNGLTFAEMPGTPELACLVQSPDGSLLGCGANWDPDFKAIARSTDNGATWEKVWRFVETNDAVQCEPGTIQHDTCDVMLWDCPTCGTDLKRQFGAKPPVCAANASDPPVPPKKGGGCCGAGVPVGVVWSLVIGGWLSRRRRRHRRR